MSTNRLVDSESRCVWVEQHVYQQTDVVVSYSTMHTCTHAKSVGLLQSGISIFVPKEDVGYHIL